MPNASPLVQKPLSGQIEELVIQRIADGVLKPGDRIVEMRLAEEMQTSQAPVREALKALEALGLIELRRNRGAVVRRLDTNEFREIYAVRAELEGFAAELAAQVSPLVEQDLLKISDEMEKALNRSDRRLFLELNACFHRTLVQAAKNATLFELWSRLDIRSRTATNLARPREDFPTLAEDHRDIARAIGRGDAAAARRCIQKHILSVMPPEVLDQSQ